MIKLYDILPELKARSTSRIPSRIDLDKLYEIAPKFTYSTLIEGLGTQRPYIEDIDVRVEDYIDSTYEYLSDRAAEVDEEADLTIRAFYSSKKDILIVKLLETDMSIILSNREISEQDLDDMTDSDISRSYQEILGVIIVSEVNELKTRPKRYKFIEGDYKVRTEKKIKEIESLDSFEVTGNLDLERTVFKKLPNRLKVGGSLNLKYSKITNLPDNLKVGEDLDLMYSPITSLPDNLIVGGELDLSYSLISTLPNNLQVQDRLDLSHTPLSTEYTADQIRRIIVRQGGSVGGLFVYRV